MAISAELEEIMVIYLQQHGSCSIVETASGWTGRKVKLHSWAQPVVARVDTYMERLMALTRGFFVWKMGLF